MTIPATLVNGTIFIHRITPRLLTAISAGIPDSEFNYDGSYTPESCYVGNKYRDIALLEHQFHMTTEGTSCTPTCPWYVRVPVLASESILRALLWGTLNRGRDEGTRSYTNDLSLTQLAEVWHAVFPSVNVSQPPLEDVVDYLTDSAGYLPCGCLGSQQDHTCGPID